MIDIVVAHYNENLEWIKELTHPNINKIYIYSKYSIDQQNYGTRQVNIKDEFNDINFFMSLNSKIIYQSIPNIGRESETYLRYCEENYNNLSDGTIFLQGEPHHDIGTIHSWIEHLDILKHDFTPNITIDTIFSNMNNGHIPMWYGKCDQSKYNTFTWFRTYVDQIIYTFNMKIYYNACFGVSRNKILSRDQQFYNQLRLLEFSTRNPEAAHFAERSWFYIFNCHIDNII